MERQLLEKIFSEYTSYLQAEKAYAPDTARAYLNAAREFLEHCRQRPGGFFLPHDWTWRHLDKRALEIYLRSLRDLRGWQAASVAQRATALRAFFRCLQGKGHIERNPLQGLQPAVPPRVPQLPEGEAEAVRAMLERPAPSLAAARLQLVLELMYGGAMRPGHVYRVASLEPQPDRGQVQVTQGDRTRVLPLSPAGLRRAVRYLEARRHVVGDAPDAPFWIDERGRRCAAGRLARAVRLALEQAGLSLRPAELRQLAARHFRERGGDVRSVQRLLGAKRLGTVDRYGPTQFQRVAEQFRRAHPRRSSSEEPD